jgi:hypothetical protein
MKKYFLIILCALIGVLAFNSCSNDDDEEDSIIGTWELVDNDNTSATFLWTFKTNGECIISVTNSNVGEASQSFSYSFNGKKIKLSLGDDSESYTVTFSSDGKTMTWRNGDDTLVFKKSKD